MKDIEEINLLEQYIDNYKEIIQRKYSHIKEHHKEAFPLLKFEGYLDYCLFKFDADLFYQPYAMVIVDNYNFQNHFLDLSSPDDNLYSQVVDDFDFEKIENYLILKYPDFKDKKIFIVETSYFNTMFEDRGKSQADRDYLNWKNENRARVDSYDHDVTSPYSHLDYEGLVRNFNIEGFNEDFKYQMEQAEECYKRRLYLPAATTLSVALETVLFALCKRENIKINNSTMLNYLGEELRSRNVINYRLAKRIDITYSLRNSLAHSNKGEVAKADCEIILNCIRTIIDNHF